MLLAPVRGKKAQKLKNTNIETTNSHNVIWITLFCEPICVKQASVGEITKRIHDFLPLVTRKYIYQYSIGGINLADVSHSQQSEGLVMEGQLSIMVRAVV